MLLYSCCGRMSERLNVLVSKTGIPKGIMGSNPIPSAKKTNRKVLWAFLFVYLCYSMKIIGVGMNITMKYILNNFEDLAIFDNDKLEFSSCTHEKYNSLDSNIS